MKKSHQKSLIFIILTILLLTINSIFNIMNIFTYLLFLLIIIIIFKLFLGFWKNKSIHESNSILMMISAALIFYFITYLGGIFIGFSKNVYDLTILGILKNITPLVFIIIIEEIMRYSLVKHAHKNRRLIVLIVIMFSLMELTLMFGNYAMNSSVKIMEFVILYILPGIITNIFLTYLSFNVGYKPAIAYRLLFSLNIYIFPIIPDFGIYIESIIKIILPITLMFLVHKNFYDKKDKVDLFDNKFSKVGLIILLFIVSVTIFLVSGLFKYQALTIGSGSMSPKIKVGDVVIIEKLNSLQKQKIKEGDILVFKNHQRIIVHRVNKIIYNSDKLLFVTKGDANKDLDNDLISESDVIGIAKIKIPAIGYPTIKLDELLYN